MRDFKSSLPADTIIGIHQGIARTTYKGYRFIKCPFDIVSYMRLIQKTLPKTIIELGTKEGGSALWFADTASNMGYQPRIVTIDNNPIATFEDERITFLEGDVLDLEKVLPESFLSSLPRPWLVVEDSGHLFETCTAALNFFDNYLHPGEYIVIEDGILNDMPLKQFEMFNNGPNRAVEAFLKANYKRYKIDASYCDFYGYNVTYSPNGWLLRY